MRARIVLAVAFVCGWAACGDDAAPAGTGGTDSAASADSVGAAETAAPADSAPAAETTTPAGDLALPAQGFQIRTPPITVPSGTEGTWCYYFTIPLEEAVGVKRWESSMTVGSHHLILYFTAEAEQPDGTVTEDCSGFGSGSLTNIPIWTYSSQEPRGQNVMPPGIGMTVGAQQHGYVQMHYLNPTLEDLEVHVSVNGETFEPGTEYVKAAPFVTFNTNILIPAGVGQTASAEGTCRVKSGIHFFAMSTHAHKRAVKTTVTDGDTTIFTSDDWEHPGAVRWDDGYDFGASLTYRCDYVNDRNAVVTAGASAETDEMCMAVGYFYPAQRPAFCINSLVVSQ